MKLNKLEKHWYALLLTGKFSSRALQLKWENGPAVTLSKEASFLVEYSLTDTVYFTKLEFSEPNVISSHGM